MSEEVKTSKTSFFKSLKSEFKKCTWPKSDDIAKQTALVLVISIVLGVVISGVDWLIRLGLQALQIVS
jgi:preprotein translocase subunit SecE